MKKLFAIALLSILLLSCSKKIDVSAKITGGSPLERLEFVDASGVGTLPLTNIGIDKNGMYTGSFQAPKDGLYMLNIGNAEDYIYLKGGQKLNFSADLRDFNNTLKITGDAQKNNDFLKQSSEQIGKYVQGLQMEKLWESSETEFLKSAKKIYDDVNKKLEEVAKKTGADQAVLNYKKDEITASILGLMSQYEIKYPMIKQNPSFKTSKAFKDYEKDLQKDNDKLVKEQPIYRNYLLNKMSTDYQVFTSAKKSQKMPETNSALFSEYLDSRKDLSQITKDYLLAFIMAQYDINTQMEPKNAEKLNTLIDNKIKNTEVKKDLQKLMFALQGPKIGTPAPETPLVQQDGKSYNLTDLKGKPTLVVFYTSWVPYFNESNVPLLKEMSNFYKAKMNFAAINLDDTKDQFVKTSNAMMKGLPIKNLYAENGLSSKTAENWGIYSFKLPTIALIDKDGKMLKTYFNLADPALVAEMDKLTGLKAPVTNPDAQLQNNFIPPPPPATTQPNTATK